VYFNNLTEGEKCVIDSDSHIEEFIPGIYEAQAEARKFEARQFPDMEEDAGKAAFTSGMNVISMDDVLDEERQKLSEETAAQTEEVLAEARKQADEIIAEANSMAESIRKQAYEDGRAAGFEEGKNLAEQETENQRTAIREDYNRRLAMLEAQEKELEPRFASIIAGLVEKLTGVICENKKDVIVHLIDNALKSIEKTTKIVIRVSKADIAAVSSKRDRLMKDIREGTEFEITEDISLSANQCIIETDNKIIDCSLDAQLASLREQIKKIAI